MMKLSNIRSTLKGKEQLTPTEEGGKNSQVSSPVSIPFNLNSISLKFI